MSAPDTTDRRIAVVLLAAGAAAALGLGAGAFSRPAPAPTVRPAVPAAARPDFRGEWQTDLRASQSLAPILKAKGRSAVEILAASLAPITHVIRGDDRRLTVIVRTPLGEQTHELPTDGTPAAVTDPEGRPATAITRWSADGRSLVTTTSDVIGGRPVPVALTRSLDPDGRTMYLDLEYHVSGTEPIRVRRVFRLVRAVETENRQ